MRPEVQLSKTEDSFEVELVPTVLTPDEMQFVEANPEAPENVPDETKNFSFRNQQTADQVAELSEDNRPRVDGELDTQKIVQGSVLEQPPVPMSQPAAEAELGQGEGTDGGELGKPESRHQAIAQPLPTPDFIQQKSVDDAGLGSDLEITGEAREVFEEPDPTAPIDIIKQPEVAEPTPDTETSANGAGGVETRERPKPRPRPKLDPSLVQGPLMRSIGSASQRGSLGIDATFSEFGEYQQQFFAAVQLGWYQEIEYFQPIDVSTRVMVRFEMFADGTIQNLEVIGSTASEVATFICESAVSKRSPYRPWTQEMIEVFGNQRTITLTFHYR